MSAPQGATSRSSRTSIILIAVVLGLVAAVGAGWWVGLKFASPAQRAAAGGPPPASIITAPVTEGTLTDQTTIDVTIAASRLQTAVLAGSGELPIVTALPLRVGATVSAGSVVIEVSGRPVFAMPGRFRFYRDLTVGDSGPDVEQLQQALTASGIAVTPDGNFGAATAQAVKVLYVRSGYTVTTTDGAADSAGAVSGSPDVVGDLPGAADQPTTTGSSDAGARSTAGAPPSAKVPLVPRSELLVFSDLPGTLSALPGIDAEVSGGDQRITVATGALVARATVSADSAQSITQGMEARLQSGSEEIQATVAQISAANSDGDSTIVFTPTQAVPEAWAKAPVLATIIKRIVAEKSLIVPSRAVVADSDGTQSVLVKQADGSFGHISVEVLGKLDGKAAVRPSAGDRLSAGDVVRVR